MTTISELIGSARNLKKDGIWFRDSEDRYVLFRGINLASRSKLPPYLPILPLVVQEFNDDSIDKFRQELKILEPQLNYLQELGFNVVRLLVMWKAVEPALNKNPEKLLPAGIKYLNCIKEVIDALYARGIYTIIDFHQDVAHEIYDGDGFPDWVIGIDKLPILSDFHSDRKNLFWALQYVTNPFVKNTLRTFWLNFQDERPRTHLEKTIGATARLFQSMYDNRGHPAILGYELFNEPHPVGLDKQKFEKDILPQYYHNVLQEIQRNLPDTKGDMTSFLFVEPRIDSTIRSVSADEFEAIHFLEEFDSVLDLSNLDGERVVFSFHYYDPLLFIPIIPKDIRQRVKEWEKIFKQLCDSAKERNTIPFLTEFGADQGWKKYPSLLPSDYEDLVRAVMNIQYELVEANLLNATYWNYDFYNTEEGHDNWNLEDFSVLGPNRKLLNQDIVARPYPLRSSAKPILLRFSIQTKHCVMIFNGKPVDAPSLIYVPRSIHYEKGFDVYATSSDIVWDENNQILSWYPRKEDLEHQLIICPSGSFNKRNLPRKSLSLLPKTTLELVQYGRK